MDQIGIFLLKLVCGLSVEGSICLAILEMCIYEV